MNRKRFLSILLAFAVLFSLTLFAGTEAFAAGTAARPREQLKLIASQIDTLKQDESESPWFYAVADLDHDGCLEFIAATLHPLERTTSVKLWTVSKDASSLEECRLDQAARDSFPDILTDTMDTYHVKDTDSWYYMVYDTSVISDSEVNTVKAAVNLKDGVLSYETYAAETTVIQDGMRAVTHTDENGIVISPEQYNASGLEAFADAEKSNTAFEWLPAAEIKVLDRLTESYEVFLGTREPTEFFPVPNSNAQDAVTPVPVPVPVQPDQSTWLFVTKNPTNENRVVGENAIFVAGASAFESLNWTFVSPDGGEYSPANFLAGSGSYISGERSTTLTVSKLESWMNGWGAYCTFYYKGQTARTSTAYMYVSNRPAPTPVPQPIYGSMSGTAYQSGSRYSIHLQNGANVLVNSWTCNIEGQFYDGCSAIVYYTDYPSTTNIYRVDIYGNMGLIVPDGATGHATGLIVPDGALGGWAGSNYYQNEAPEGQGGWAGKNYYENEDPEGQGGWAGKNYYLNEIG